MSYRSLRACQMSPLAARYGVGCSLSVEVKKSNRVRVNGGSDSNDVANDLHAQRFCRLSRTRGRRRKNIRWWCSGMCKLTDQHRRSEDVKGKDENEQMGRSFIFLCHSIFCCKRYCHLFLTKSQISRENDVQTTPASCTHRRRMGELWRGKREGLFRPMEADLVCGFRRRRVMQAAERRTRGRGDAPRDEGGEGR